MNSRTVAAESAFRKAKVAYAEAQRQLVLESARANKLSVECKKQKEAADAAVAAKAASEKGLASASSEIDNLKDQLVVKEARIKELSSEVLALAEESNNAPSYREMIRRFLGSNGFFRYLNQKASPLFAQGFSALAGLIGEGNVYDPKVHTLQAFSNNLLKEDGQGEGEGAAEQIGPDPKADPEAELTLEEIYGMEPEMESEGEEEAVDGEAEGAEDGGPAEGEDTEAGGAEAVSQAEVDAAGTNVD